MDVEQLRKQYKEFGMGSIKRKEFSKAIRYFNLWQNCYPSVLGIDRYEGDDEIIDCIEKNVPKYENNISKPEPGEKIRIAYLAHGMTSPSSIAVKILLNIVKHHNKKKFEIHIFTTDSYLKVLAYPGRGFIRQFREIGCQLHFAPPHLNGWRKVKGVADEIYSYQPHILITSAALADFGHYFISAMQTAPIRIGFVWATPSLFISKYFDYGITFLNRIAKSCMIPCLIASGISYVQIQKNVGKISRADLGIPDNAVVLVSAGRKEKFQGEEFFYRLIKVKDSLPDLHCLIIGATQNQIRPLKNIISSDARNRMYYIGWSADYEKYLSIADIYLDTYPGGGGGVLMDAAMRRIPIISFTDNESPEFGQHNWNPASELFPEGSIFLVDRNNLSSLEKKIENLVNLIKMRTELPETERAYRAVKHMGENIYPNVRKIESSFEQLVQEKLR